MKNLIQTTTYHSRVKSVELSTTPPDCDWHNDMQFNFAFDNKTIALDPQNDIFSMSYVNGDHPLLSVMSESYDLQSGISAFSTTLGKKVLAVYDCDGPSECEMSESDENQFVLLAPYVKDPLPPISDSRSSYKAPELGLSPMLVTITDVLDEQLAGSGFPTTSKRNI